MIGTTSNSQQQNGLLLAGHMGYWLDSFLYLSVCYLHDNWMLMKGWSCSMEMEV